MNQKVFGNTILVVAVLVVVGVGAYFVMINKPSILSINSIAKIPTTQQNTYTGTQPTQINTPLKTVPVKPVSSW